jgi:hypothetical protein
MRENFGTREEKSFRVGKAPDGNAWRKDTKVYDIAKAWVALPVEFNAKLDVITRAGLVAKEQAGIDSLQEDMERLKRDYDRTRVHEWTLAYLTTTSLAYHVYQMELCPDELGAAGTAHLD